MSKVQSVLNLILTRECPKRCSFCFTGDYSKETEMSLDFIDRVVTRFSPDLINLLGGEPTRHSKFQEIHQLMVQCDQKYQLVSNFLFSRRTLEYLLENFKCRESALVNGMELLEKDSRFRLFKKNWNTIFQEHRHLYRIAMSFTITLNHTPDYFRKYIRILKKELTEIPFLRIGLDLSTTKIVNNKNYGHCILAIQEELPDSIITFDCQVPMCIWDFDPMEKLNKSNLSTLHQKCSTTTLDTFHDGSVITCYPSPHIKVDNIFDFNNGEDLSLELRRQYKEEERNRKDILEVCKTCRFYLSNDCNSLCIGCYTGGHGMDPKEI